MNTPNRQLVGNILSVLAVLFICLILVTACTGAPGDTDDEKIQNCILLGGRPSFTSDKDGNAHFIACDYYNGGR